MRDYDLALRTAYFNALKGQVKAPNGVEVPIVDAKLEYRLTENDFYINMNSQDQDDLGVKRQNMMRANFQMDIVHRLKTAVSAQWADLIADKVLLRLFPYPDQKERHILQIDPAFQLTAVRLTGTNRTGMLKIEDGHMIVKTLTFSQILILR
jgi:hypothetical protein